MTGRFEYQELSRSGRGIRLLELLPSTHHLSKIRPACRIIHTRLDDNPSFLALSYVWGDEEDKRVIIVDKRPFRVTRNLYEAMIGLRESKSMIIWIDAICINQLDDEEKGWQVSLMGGLYKKASAVIAWLGASADHSDDAIDHLDVLGEQAEACGLHDGPKECAQIWEAITTRPSYMDDPATIVLKCWIDGKQLLVPKHALESLLQSLSGWKSQNQVRLAAALYQLLRRPWWGRVWVLQEITLPRHAYFACGTKRISRRKFRAAFNAYYALCNVLGSKTQRRQALTSYEAQAISVYSYRTDVMLSMSSLYKMERFSLVALLRATCFGSAYHLQQGDYQHLESKNPRDKIFALLGLARDQKELEALGVFPDYTKSKEEVYIATMAALLQQNHVSILSMCRASGIRSAMPSWAPDWSVPTSQTLQHVDSDHLTLYPSFSASGLERQCQVIVCKKNYRPARIYLRAAIYDEVLQVGSIPRFPLTGASISSEHWLYEILRLAYLARDIYTDFDERLHAVIRTSHAATGFGKYTFLQRVDRYLDALPVLKGGIQLALRQDMKRDLKRFFASKEREDRLELTRGDPFKLFLDLIRITPERLPFVTMKGHLGLTSQCVRQGDVIAMIGGAQVPFVLRRCDSTKYKIVGEAYVDGIMDGEAAARSKWEHIELV